MGNAARDGSCEKDQGAITLVLDLARAFERVSIPVVWAWATHFDFPRKLLACTVRVLCEIMEANAVVFYF